MAKKLVREAEPVVYPIDDRGNPIPDELVLRAQTGDGECREYLIREYQPYVLKITSRCCKRFVREGVDEEISIALLAFNEAIDGYKPNQGSRFLSFARLVIERRLTDYFRRSRPKMLEVPLQGYSGEENEESSAISPHEREASEKAFLEWQSSRDRREEISYYNERLKIFGITLDQLVKLSPKHSDARKRAIQVAKSVAANPNWRNHFIRYRELPLKEMEREFSLSRKTLERQRKYIVALTLVYIEDLPHIREYLKGED